MFKLRCPRLKISALEHARELSQLTHIQNGVANIDDDKPTINIIDIKEAIK